MSRDEIIAALRQMSRDDLRAVANTARDLLLASDQEPGENGTDDWHILKHAGCLSGGSITAQEIEQTLYGSGEPLDGEQS